MRIRYLTKREILEIHNRVLEGTNEDKTVLSEGNLELCVETPSRQIFGFEPHKDLVDKACCLLLEINRLHPFYAGNKRTAYQATAIMLLNNGYVLRANRREAVAVSKYIGFAGRFICHGQASKWLRKRVRHTH